MPNSKNKTKYNMQYAKDKLKRIPLDVQKDKYEEIKAAADQAGESVNGFIKNAIDERIERLPGEMTYFSEKWGGDDTQRIKLAEQYVENDIPRAIEREEERKEGQEDDYIQILYSINSKYAMQLLTNQDPIRQKLWAKIEDEHGENVKDIHEFFDSFIEEYDNTINEMRTEYIQANVAPDSEDN